MFFPDIEIIVQKKTWETVGGVSKSLTKQRWKTVEVSIRAFELAVYNFKVESFLS